MSEELVRVNKYSRKVLELPHVRRVSPYYPLLVRDSVARKLANVADKLPHDFRLQVDSGYRTRATQVALWNYRRADNPLLVADPHDSPPHLTGGAVDVALLDAKGREINMSEPFGKFYDEPQLVSDKISPRAQELRGLLRTLMTAEGFVPNPAEYWHFSYGDKRWANVNKKDQLYDEIDLEKSMYYPFLKYVSIKFLRTFYRVLNKVFYLQTNY